MCLDLVHDRAGLFGRIVEVDWIEWAYRGGHWYGMAFAHIGGKHLRLLESQRMIGLEMN